jgi:hypothetical protein
MTAFCEGGCKDCSITFDCCTVEDYSTEMTMLTGGGQETSNTVFSLSNNVSGKTFSDTNVFQHFTHNACGKRRI